MEIDDTKKKVSVGMAVFLMIMAIVIGFLGGMGLQPQEVKAPTVATKTKVETVAPKATVTASYDKSQIKSVIQLNNNQYTVHLVNGQTIVANVGSGNPPTTKLLKADKPLVVETNYWTSYKNSWDFVKEKSNHNIVIYLDK